ncbi:hypothetical protein IGI69_003375 [Enterococcus sp. DIV1083b]|uniref:glycoside hydrolase family 2 TIM barrel-domain containing protein n=1 Tax=Enterococcus sp. DIV1083b TaxID=2774661 RepID=UPI003F24B32B
MKKISFNDKWFVTKSGTESVVESFSNNQQEGKVAITLPHDGMISEERCRDTKNGGQTGYYPGGTYYYSKSFYVPSDWKHKKVMIEFEGIQGLSKINVNGNFVASSYNGYINTLIDLNSFLVFDEINTIEVRANNEMEQNSRWYTGSGIYRDVNLYIGSTTNIPVYGVKIKSSVTDDNCGVIDLDLTINNEDFNKKKLDLFVEIFNKEKEVVTCQTYPITINGHSMEKINQKLFVEDPLLWSCETPNLYSLAVSISEDNRILDKTTTKFGIRNLTLDPFNGLKINGEVVKLRGSCLHHDNGLIGAVSLENAERRKLEQLKKAGFNSIRSSHNPMSELALSICDELGILVMDELTDSWNQGKNINDYSNYFCEFWENDLRKMVDKDFNHPSVILYSTGNEIKEAGSAIGAKMNREITNKFHELDPTRYVTNGINGILATGEKFNEIIMDIIKDMDSGENHKNNSETNGEGGSNALNSMQAVLVGDLADAIATHPIMDDMLSEFVDAMDIAGYNYLTGRHEREHELYPHRIVLGTETFPGDIVNLWTIVKNNSHVIGDFTWTGYDYLGEAGVGVFYYDGYANFYPHFPDRTAYIGDIDIIGNRRPISYYREIVYGLRKEPYIAVERVNKYGQESSHTPWMWKDTISSWTWTGYEGKPANVFVLSDADEVELFLNNKSLGRKPVGVLHDYQAEFELLYQPGELKVISYRDGKVAEETEIETANSSKILLIEADKNEMKANGQDLIYAMIKLTDETGRINKWDTANVNIDIEGPCSLAGFGSANPSSEGNYFDKEWETYDGCALVVIRSSSTSGNCKLIVEAEGYESSEFIFTIV